MRFLAACVAIIIFNAHGNAGENGVSDWPQFRGPKGDGHASARNLPKTWGNYLSPFYWQARIPGRGWSSPIVINDRVWLTTSETIALPENLVATKLESLASEAEDFQTHRSVSFYAIELDLSDGKILRQINLMHIDQPPPIHASNSYASPTPTSDGKYLYCHFGSLGTVAVELISGAIVWKKVFAVDDITGSGSSPVLYGNRLFFACDGADHQFMIAVDKFSGEVLWKTDRPPIESQESFLRRAFSTPIIIEHAGRTQLISSSAQWLVSYNMETGEEWWRCRTAKGYSVVPQPVFHQGLVFACTGYMKPELWAIRADGSGDVSATHLVWKYARQVPEIASPIVIEGNLYLVSKSGVISCLQTADGRQLWQHRLEGSFASSPVFADGKLFLTNHSGITFVVEPGLGYTELAKNATFGETMATIAIAQESILIRTDAHLYCIRQSESNR